MRYPLIDSRLRKRIMQHWPSRCNIQSVNYTLTASNQKMPGTNTDVVGMFDIPCRLGPFIDTRLTDTEHRTQSILSKSLSRRCKLGGYYPAIDTRRMVAVVDGSLYQIRGVEHDSERAHTSLRLEVITP